MKCTIEKCESNMMELLKNLIYKTLTKTTIIKKYHKVESVFAAIILKESQ